MAKRSILVGLALAATLGACAERAPTVAYTTPGWYLVRPRLIQPAGPEFFAGPFTYDHCETERMKFDSTAAQRLLCIHQKANPGIYGPYSGTVT